MLLRKQVNVRINKNRNFCRKYPNEVVALSFGRENATMKLAPWIILVERLFQFRKRHRLLIALLL